MAVSRWKGARLKPRPHDRCVGCLHSLGFGAKWIARATAIPFRTVSRRLKSCPECCFNKNKAKMLRDGAPKVGFIKPKSRATLEHDEWVRVPKSQRLRVNAFLRESAKFMETGLTKKERHKASPGYKNLLVKGRTSLKIKIKNRLRRRIRKLIHDGVSKSKTWDLLGCNWNVFKDHFESLFKNGMGWHNHGRWHVDHIIPCSAFDLTDPAQQRQCFHYTNLQPLWAADNLRKLDKVPVAQPELALPMA